MKDTLILKKLKELIDEGNRLKKLLYNAGSESAHMNEIHYQNCEKWKGSSLNLLKIRFGENSDYYEDFSKHIRKYYPETQGGLYYPQKMSLAIAVLQYVYDALKSGLTEDLYYKKEVELFSDLLEQAFEFLNKKFKLISAIYGRIVLEVTILEYAKKKGINEGKFDQVIIKLRQANIISKPFESSLRANYQIGSDAVHRNKQFEDYSDKEIKEFLIFIRDKVLTLK